MAGRHAKLISTLAIVLFSAWADPAISSESLLRIKGSDTLANVTNEWAKAYTDDKSELKIVVDGGGSGNGIAALINGHVEIANTSRKLRNREKNLIANKSNAKPYAIIVGLDAVSVAVHHNNPLNGISLSQLAGIYGKKSKYNTWSDLGVTVPGCESGKIIRVSRKNNSGTYAFFRQTIFGKRAHFNNSLVTRKSSKAVVDHIIADPCAIGYSAMSFLNNDLKTLCVAKTSVKNGCVPPTASFTLNNQYPLARPLFMYTLGEPEGETRSFLAWVRSQEGQDILRKAGFVSPPNK
ncbi:MAG: phosphate ABC transporter substrate-binding protein [Magnetococcales bacterium]|nr:phosphate ABC transporter substrate-binding protein [Magnetococcales bacterium]